MNPQFKLETSLTDPPKQPDDFVDLITSTGGYPPLLLTSLLQIMRRLAPFSFRQNQRFVGILDLMDSGEQPRGNVNAPRSAHLQQTTDDGILVLFAGGWVVLRRRLRVA
jgi:hypothetical protein